MAVAVGAVGSPAAGNAAVTPAIPAGATVGNVLLLFAGARSSSEIAAPTGWDRLVGPDTDTSDARAYSVFVRVYQSGDGNPTLASVGDAQIGQIVELTGAEYDGTQASLLHDIEVRWRSSGSQNIGPVTSAESPAEGLFIVGGFKGDDFTAGHADLTGDGLTWTSIVEAETTAGNDGSLHVASAPTPSLITPANKTFTITGGGATAGMGRSLSIKAASGGGGVTGTAAQTLPALAQDAAADALVDGTAASDLPALSQDAAGTVTDNSVTGTAAQTLPQLSQDAAGQVSVDASASQTLPALGQDSAGALTVDGTAAPSLPALTQDAAGAASVSGASASDLPALTQDASGTVVEEGALTGTADQVLPALEAAASADASVNGAAASGLPGLSSAASGTLTITGSAGGTLGALATAAGGTITVAGDGAAVLPGLATDAAGDVTAGDLADLAQLTLAAVAKHELTLAAAPLRLLTLTAELKALTVAADAGPTLTLAATHKHTLELEASIP